MDEPRVWCVSLNADLWLIHAPYHGITTLVNRASLECVRRCLTDRSAEVPADLDWIRRLREPGIRQERRHGQPDPLYLGIIPTRACTLQCAYCDFSAEHAYPLMSLDMIRQTVDGYAKVLKESGTAEWQTHFFGGEPFTAYKEAVFAVNYIRRKARELGLPTHFEVTTNGFYSAEKSRWIAENFDTVVLSFDGFPPAQDRHRPAPGRIGSFETVCRNADIFAKGDCELIIRSCVSAENVEVLPRWAAFIAERFFPSAVVLEPMIESPLSRKNGLLPPDPDLFAKKWITAFPVLEELRIPLVYSSGEIGSLKMSLCPMGQDAMIVTPDGTVGGCWQLAENRKQAGIDLGFGRVEAGGLRIDAEALEKQRELSEANRERCTGCFCYAHCAGGCLLNRDRNGSFCRMTRVLTLWQLIRRLGYDQFVSDLLTDRDYIDWISSIQDFSVSVPFESPGPGHETDSGNVPAEPDDLYDFSGIPLSPLPEDPVRGMIRDGDRILEIDPVALTIRVSEKEAALRIQLENSGMTAAETEAVWNALQGGTD